jgi:hypothetical protein
MSLYFVVWCYQVVKQEKLDISPTSLSLATLVDNFVPFSGSGSGQRRSPQAEEVCEGHPTVGDK